MGTSLPPQTERMENGKEHFLEYYFPLSEKKGVEGKGGWGMVKGARKKRKTED